MRVVREAVTQLEQQLASRLGVSGGVAAGFGRSALALALEALEVRGGEVLVPDFICAQVPEAVRRAGGRPVFYPVRRDLTVDSGEFAARLSPAARAAIAAHYFGRPLPEVEQLAALCRERRVPLIENCALALEASLFGRRAGRSGEIAVFSFTKSGWCYGGGMATSNAAELLARMRAVREEKFRVWPSLSFRYGLLRQADFAANRPSRSRLAEHTGRWLERWSGLRGGNFYDAGRFDAALPEFAARRARRLLGDIPAATARRQQIMRLLAASLDDGPKILFRPQLDGADAASFLLLECPSGRAEPWVENAARGGVTLRRCWPAYQPMENEQSSEDLGWLADHLLVLEIHPLLSDSEVKRIAQTLGRLAAE